MLILKGENGKSKVITDLLEHTNSICFIYYDQEIQLDGLFVNSKNYSVEQFSNYIEIYFDNNDDKFYDYVVIYTNFPEEEIENFPWVGWINHQVIITCV